MCNAVQSSCKDCKNRTIGCHATCEAYKKYKEEHAKYRKQQDIQNFRHFRDYSNGNQSLFIRAAKKNRREAMC